MVSVLIPTYNYNVSKLIEIIHSQLVKSTITFEIIIFEDGSFNSIKLKKNLKNTTIVKNITNIGRVKARQELAKKAIYEWLLFLDADVLPKTEFFISNYINAVSLKKEVYFGGFAYYENKPKQSHVLRWKYGKSKEQVTAKLRNRNPYKVIISANYLIKKSIFTIINSKIKDNKGYGFDTYFGALLQDNKINVLHIDNEVYHLGIEKSELYLKKVDQAAITLLHFHRSEGMTNHSNDLLLLFSKLKRYKLAGVFSLLYKIFNNRMKKNLLNKSPSILILQLYKICFICYAYKKEITV